MMEMHEIPTSIEDFAKAKRSKLFERVALFATVMGLFHSVQDLLHVGFWTLILDIAITLTIFLCYWIHRWGYINTARIVALALLNVLFTIYACLVPQEVGIYLFYFPLIAISMAIFGNQERAIRNFFVAVSIGFLLALFATDFNLIGSYQIESAHESSYFMINLTSSTFILVVCIHFILKVNEESERRLQLLAEEVRIKNVDLEKTNTELDRFLYSTSHDLRSPILSVKGLIHIARKEATEESTINYLSMMTDRVNRLDLFISDIINYAKNSRMEITPTCVNLPDLVSSIKESCQFLEGANQIDFHEEFFVPEIMADQSRLTVVLNNLISNAVKYHNPECASRWIQVSSKRIDKHIQLIIADNGSGIEPERQSKIFDMFYRGTEQSTGSGLGLYIVKEAIEKMNGTIRVNSLPQVGTSFIILLPYIEIDTAPAIA